MSAYIVTDKTITALVTALFSMRNSKKDEEERLLLYFSKEGGRYFSKEEIGQCLLDENYRSVNHRYKEQNLSRGYRYLATYKAIRDLTPVLILKLCNHYDYQSCETNAYRSSTACEIIQKIRLEMIN